MFGRRFFIIAAVATAAFPAIAMEPAPFNKAAFAAAQAAGAPILIAVTAPWCPVCKAQAPIIKGVAAKPEFARLKVFAIDFDSRKDLLREFNVQTQSTLILFKGKTETGRSTGDTNGARIETLMRSAI